MGVPHPRRQRRRQWADKYRAFYVETGADGTKNYVAKWVSYSKDLLFKTKDALKAHCNPSFFYHPPTTDRGGVWFSDQAQYEPWIYDAIVARGAQGERASRGD